MTLCTRHPHSSEQSARKCYAKRIAIRLDKRLGKFLPQPTRYAQVRCNPPEVLDLHGIVVYLFYKGTPRQDLYTLEGQTG